MEDVSALVRDGFFDEEAVTAGLAKEAETMFQSRRFHECVEVLKQLLVKKENDPKVLHNIALAEYYRDGFSDRKHLIDFLNKLKKTSEELALKARDQTELASMVGNNVNSISRGSSNSSNQLAATDTVKMAYADEFGTSVVTFNIAAVLYHLHDYEHALSVLEPLYNNIEPIDERTALHVCLLMLDIALATKDATRAADVIHYLERSFGVGYTMNQMDSGTNPQHQSSNQGSKLSTANVAAPDVSSSETGASGHIIENPLTGTLSDDSIEFENLYSTLDGGNQSLGRPVTDISKMTADRIVPGNDLKQKIHLHKVRLLLLTRNLKAAKREVKLAMNVARGRDSSAELLLKSQLEYARGNNRKAVKLLMTSMNKTEPAMLSMFNNNVGCIQFQLKAPHTSALFFTKALRFSSSLRSEKPLELSTFSKDNSFVIIYNCGLQNLACGKPVTAAQCFGKASMYFYNKPIFWLRLAECCLSAMDKGIFRISAPEIKLHVVGSGKWRQLVLEEDVSSRTRYLKGAEYMSGVDERYKLSLPFARLCLHRALFLLDKFEKKGPTPSAANDSVTNGDHKENKVGLSSNTTLQSSVIAFEELCKEENSMIKQALLGNLAYIELCLENPLKALSAANSLLQLPDCSKIYTFFGRMYAAEALCFLNRPKEAAEYLSVYFNENGKMELPYTDDDREKWNLKRGMDGEDLNGSQNARTVAELARGGLLKSEEARAVACVNLSIMFSLQGNPEQANQFIQKALSYMPKDPRVLIAGVFVDLLQNKSRDALSKLKLCNNTRYVSAC
ncbi:CCR4-NOT transcription complex subunit 10 isoform X2 [Phalaenopsis equestris]|uniref:CCR4-NOT transcription complex subunit 10 isoform X2 n=1 Tax=Phalaenopsis equestris TaxID=78828 RepID=UPI0009E4ECF9|nr:CCR4-NOT transcription complex subunit 10 isoform X2 [Phalaenopsis equestris]